MEYDELMGTLFPTNLAQATYRFSAEDAKITKDFEIHSISDSYDPSQLVPEDISLKVAKAYSYIKSAGLEGKGYLEQSLLGRKIQIARDHDRNFIIQIITPVVKEVNFSKDDWAEQLGKKTSELFKQDEKSEQKKFEPIGKNSKACLERIKRYVQKGLPEQWR